MDLLNVFLALLWLGGAILFARTNRPEEVYQLRRVPRAAGAFVAGTALLAYLPAALAGQLGVIVFHVTLIGLILLGMLAFLSALIVDIVAILLGATRTPPWLAAGIVAAVGIPYGWLFLLGQALWGGGPELSSATALTPGLIAAASAVIWWSELPRLEPDESAVFD